MKPDLRLVDATLADVVAVVRDVVRGELENLEAPPVYLTLKETAKLLNVCAKTVQKFAREDGLPMHRAGRQARFRRDEVERWARERGQEV